ncbi:MAG: ribose 5-phosphate isomerase B [Clostridiales bacterium]|nr:ribose 5-phosphate isomerase B [Clostridiales bacterium]
MIAVACDHTGFDLKGHVLAVLEEMGLPYKDFGTNGHGSVDYPLYARKAAQAVASGECEFGIVLCGTGQGVGITSNKVHGVRCAICSEPYSAKMGREHNDANMLAMGARVVGSELAKMIVRTFLTSEFQGDRHMRRVNQINKLDEQR